MHRATKTLTIIATLLLTSCMHPKQDTFLIASDYGVDEYVLDNGIKLLVSEDHRAPVVVSQVWYRIGSADEYGGVTGVSHILEHMMFKGTAKYSRLQFTETIQRYGGRNNAFTGTDYTAYYQVFEKERLAVSFDLESDRMVNLILRQQDFEKELNVVKEERRWRIDDKPVARLREHLYSVALDHSPYQSPIVGWRNDLDNMSLADIRAWYQNWYAPNNAVIVVVGDVESEQVLALAQEYFGGIKPRELPERKPRNETAQKGERRTELKANTAHSHITIAYRAPRIGNTQKSWHPYALMVLSELLSGSASSRFERNLVRGKEVAQYINVGYSAYNRHDSLFSISASPVVGIDIPMLEENINREIDAMRNAEVSSDELTPVKVGLIASEVFRRDSVQHQAYLLGNFETIGVGWKELFELRSKIEAITPQQVREVAQIYLRKDNRTVAILKSETEENQ